MTLFFILKVIMPLRPAVCLFGIRVNNIQLMLRQQFTALAFWSVKCIIVMNWKIRDPNCFSSDIWLKEFMDLLSMERGSAGPL